MCMTCGCWMDPNAKECGVEDSTKMPKVPITKSALDANPSKRPK